MNSRGRHRVAFVLIWLVCMLSTDKVHGEKCKPVTDLVRKEITIRVRGRLGLKEPVEVISEHPIPHSCYVEMLISSRDLPQAVKLYLDPERHYISASLEDITVGASQVERWDDETMSSLLLKGSPPARGDEKASTTVVVFCDFECPFCRQLFEGMKDAPEFSMSKVRLVFRSFPLRMHPWAESAAEIAACAQEQSDSAFWTLHDYFFQHQAEININNLIDNVHRLASDSPTISTVPLDTCVKERRAEATVATDLDLARRLGIQSTPTVFINGRHLSPDLSTEEILDQITKSVFNQGSPKRESRVASKE